MLNKLSIFNYFQAICKAGIPKAIGEKEYELITILKYNSFTFVPF